MNTTQLEASTTRWNLLEHPFYQAWNDGTLPLSDLQSYAAEYGAFIGAIPMGWSTVGDTAHAAEEVEHAELWRQFARGIDTDVVESNQVPEMATLVANATELFTDHATAIGALYAFEAQQPKTSSTKLVGLKAHFDVSASAQTYFDVHADDYGEAEQLGEMYAKLDASDQKRADDACARVCEDLWNALSGVHSGDC